MSPKNPVPLPEPLRYLQPFANALAKLHPETTTIRQMLATVLVSFVAGFAGVCVRRFWL